MSKRTTNIGVRITKYFLMKNELLENTLQTLLSSMLKQKSLLMQKQNYIFERIFLFLLSRKIILVQTALCVQLLFQSGQRFRFVEKQVMQQLRQSSVMNSTRVSRLSREFQTLPSTLSRTRFSQKHISRDSINEKNTFDFYYFISCIKHLRTE